MQNKQRLELADYEAENLARLQKTFARKWEFVFMQAEAQAKLVSASLSYAVYTVIPCAVRSEFFLSGVRKKDFN